MIRGPLFNPAWALSAEKIAWIVSSGDRFAVQVFDLDVERAEQLHDWDPARFGGMVPSPVRSPDGQWLAVVVLANGPEGSGVWLLASDGSEGTLVDSAGSDPYWVDDTLLVFNAKGEAHIYDVTSAAQFPLVLPEYSSVVQFTDPADLPASTASIPAAETSVKYILTLQDVTMRSGPGEEYGEIGSIFDGQTALVTG